MRLLRVHVRPSGRGDHGVRSDDESIAPGPGELVPAALRNPRALAGWPLARWESLVRLARRSSLLSRIALDLRDLDLLDEVPPAPRAHLDAAIVLASAQERDIRREVNYILEALRPAGVLPVLLKGAAYLMAGLPAARGRIFSDVDILVPREQIHAVEAALMLCGWATTHHNPYDQHYYRSWMHELPPMRHVARHTVLDVHHAILPLTARLKPDSAKLLAGAVPVDGVDRLRVLAPIDMVLHSAAHLFCNEEFSHGLRDVVDLDELLRHFAATEPGFWSRLVERAIDLDLVRPLYYGLHHAARIMATDIPAHALRAAEIGKPALVGGLTDALFRRVLEIDHPLTCDRFSATARRLLYVRGHWLRMPPHLLGYHLAVKALRREAVEETAG